MKDLLLLVIIGIACTGAVEDTTKEKTSCNTIFCALGQECVEKNGKAICDCIEKCNDPYKPVCGSNGTHMKTYDSECELLRAACLEENDDDKTIAKVADTTCDEVTGKDKMNTEKIEMDKSKPKPVVCLAKDRDNMRSAIIAWISQRVNLEVEDLSYKGMLMKYFNMLDSDNDGLLDTMEFMKLVEGDKSITELLSKDDHSNPVLRGLCLGEVMAITDINSDYKLEFDEFHRCLNPDYHPPTEYCELDGKVFKDGDDITQDCNTCKCACGHWVCTHLDCKENSSKARLQV